MVPTTPPSKVLFLFSTRFLASNIHCIALWMALIRSEGLKESEALTPTIETVSGRPQTSLRSQFITWVNAILHSQVDTTSFNPSFR